MKFRKINDKTINCIITQEDLKKHGIKLDDLFDRKKNAVEFIRAIIMKAVSSVNFNIKNEYTSMRLSVLPDHSVSLTISSDPSESEKIRNQKQMSAMPGQAQTANAGTDRQGKAEASSAQTAGIYLFRFGSLLDMAPCCRVLCGVSGIESAVYRDNTAGCYYLILEKGEEADARFDSAMVSVNEFGRMVTCSESTLAYLKEHSDCIVKRCALQRIAELSD